MGLREKQLHKLQELYMFDPLTPISDQDRISPCNIKKISNENKENINLGIQVIQAWVNEKVK